MITRKEKARQTLMVKGALAAVGIRREQIVKVMQKLHEAAASERPLRIKRKDWGRIAARLPSIGSKVLLMRTVKGVRVFSQAGHQALRDNANRNQPWKKKARTGAAAK